MARISIQGRRPDVPGSEWPALVLWSLLILLALAYGLLFVAHLAGNIAAIDWVSDYSSGFTLAETLSSHGTGGHTVISTTGAYVPVWFGLATAWLPLHRQLWEIAPTVLFVFTALAIGWSVTRLATRRAGLLAVLIVVIASPWALHFFMAAVAHNVVWPGTALLGVFVVWTSGGRATPRQAIAVAAAGAVALGTCIASDSLLIVTGVVPLAASALAAALTGGGRGRLMARCSAGMLVGAVPVALITKAVMKSAGYATVPTSPRIELASLSTVPKHARLLVEGMRELGNGYLADGWPGTLHTEIGIACDVVVAAACLALLYAGIATSVGYLRHRRSLTDPVRSLHVIYWFVSALVVVGTFLFTTAGGNGERHESYYATLIFSIAAVVPLLRARTRAVRWLVPLAACIFFLGGVVGLKRNYIQLTEPQLARYASEITRLARDNGAETGYAGYWDASSLTWNSRNRVAVRPLLECPNPKGAPICPFVLMRSPWWYVPEHRRSFLLVDPNEFFVTKLPPGLGRPIASYAIGPLSLYVYPYDIAEKLGPPST